MCKQLIGSGLLDAVSDTTTQHFIGAGVVCDVWSTPSGHAVDNGDINFKMAVMHEDSWLMPRSALLSGTLGAGAAIGMSIEHMCSFPVRDGLARCIIRTKLAFPQNS